MNGYLIDENVPGRILFTPSLPIIHATDLGSSVSDCDLWAYARSHSPAILTKEADFSHRIMISDPPPWIVHLRFGNLRRQKYHQFLLGVWPQIEKMLLGCKLINVFLDRIEGVR